MATRVKRLYGDKVSGTNAVALYWADGFDTIADVDGYIKTFPAGDNEIPYTWAGLYLQLPCGIEEVGPKQFTITATYSPRGAEAVAPGSPESPAEQEEAADHGDGNSTTQVPPEISFSCIGGTQRRTQSLGTISRVTRLVSQPLRDHKGAIGVGEDGKVEGVEVIKNIPRWTLKVSLPAAAVTGAWVKTLEDMAIDPPVNSEPFFGYAPGEVLFEGIQELGNKGASGNWDGQFNFLIQRNREYVTVYSNPNNALEEMNVRGENDGPVEGWDYIWVEYEQIDATVETPGGTKRVKLTVPRQANLDRVYRRADLNALGLKIRRRRAAAGG
ncbi:MAG: hypothetical protein KF873_01970 [Gemmataceae bacterium]|nr:hypothetical protein [Gemmataceae bacterium]